jgi:hypothetical protein
MVILDRLSLDFVHRTPWSKQKEANKVLEQSFGPFTFCSIVMRRMTSFTLKVQISVGRAQPACTHGKLVSFLLH